MSPNPNRRRSEDLKMILEPVLDDGQNTKKSEEVTVSKDDENAFAASSGQTHSTNLLDGVSSRKDLPIYLNGSKNIRLMQEPRLFSEAELDERKIIYYTLYRICYSRKYR